MEDLEGNEGHKLATANVLGVGNGLASHLANLHITMSIALAKFQEVSIDN